MGALFLRWKERGGGKLSLQSKDPTILSTRPDERASGLIDSKSGGFDGGGGGGRIWKLWATVRGAQWSLVFIGSEFMRSAALSILARSFSKHAL